MCISSLHSAPASINQQLIHACETVHSIIRIATDSEWWTLYGVREVVPLLFTSLPLAIMQNFSLHNTIDTIYGDCVAWFINMQLLKSTLMFPLVGLVIWSVIKFHIDCIDYFFTKVSIASIPSILFWYFQLQVILPSSGSCKLLIFLTMFLQKQWIETTDVYTS